MARLALVREGPFPIPVGASQVTGIAYPAKAPRATLLLAHGAGAPQRHPYLVHLAGRLGARGVSVATFDFEYTEQRRKLPDPAPKLEACLAAAFATVKANADGPLFAGGKSMGGRISTQCAAKGAIDPRGLVLLGYPLHPPKRPTQLRDEHLPAVRAPMLFVQGARDPFGGTEEIAPLAAKLAVTAPGTRFHEVVGGDHSHAVLKRDGVPQATVDESIADAIAAWMLALL
jgi:predicted alpha/beta-hydrolase family hydrolase